ncbi:MAG: M13 family peptidase [Bryobacterales bacterium]|nr:M13 family peptidase [Bryobacterales bacterium]
MKTLFALCLLSFSVWGQTSPMSAPGFDPSAIDRKADPCVDFYQYACGAWMAANPIPSDQSRWGRFDALAERNREILHKMLEEVSAARAGRSGIEQKMGDYYAACMDETTVDAKGAAPMKPDLDRIAAIRNKEGITDVVAYLFRNGANPFFRFASGPDAKNSSQVIADLDQGGLGLPDRDYYSKTDEKSVELRKQYVAHVQKMLELAGVGADAAAKQAQAVMAIETELAKASLDRVARRDPEKLYHKMTLKELDALGTGIAWAKFFKGLGAPKFPSLNVDVPEFVRAVNGVISSHSLDDLKAYLTWNLVRDSATALSKPFQEEAFNFFGKTLRGAKEMRVRWKRCVELTDQQLPDALGRKFVETTLGAEGMRRTHEMVGEIEEAMAGDLQSLAWMTPATQQQALVKLRAVLNKIGTNDKWETYSTIKISRDDFYGNTGRASQYEIRRTLARIGKPTDKALWEMSQPTVNAYYDPVRNNINFPAGILQPPFYDNQMDDAVNYGAIGSVIGHELTHGFDDEGRQFDAQGNLRDWWTEADAKAFTERADCLVGQYGGYTAVENIKLNGKLTLGENTADNGGLRLAYMALIEKLGGKEPPLKDGFTAAQRFFLGWGQIWCQNVTPETARLRAQTDPHSPGGFRVVGAVSNMPEFQKAFACKVGQPMVRAPACRVW